MIGILIKYKEKTVFSKLPKDSAKLERQISGIGLDVPLRAVNLSNHNDHGYEIEIFTQDKFDDEIVSHIVSKDDLAQLNALLEYVSKESVEEMYRRICDSFADSVSELHRKLTATAEMEKDGLRTVKVLVTDSERWLLDLISRAADRMATFAHLGSSEFTFDDVLSDLESSPEDIKDMLIHAVAQKLESKPDIASVKVSTLDTPLQPEITVLTKEEMEGTAAETEELSGLSF